MTRNCYRTMMLASFYALATVLSGQNPIGSPYPPTGKLIDIGGYRVHLDCRGTGSPTVMIVGGGFSFDWSLVQPEIARETRVCTYDASGNAWSDPGPGRGCPAWTNEIHQLLKHADIEGPSVLVGLSAGAVIARLYATSYPGEVSGLVIIDHAFLPKPDNLSTSAPPVRGVVAADSPPAVLSMTPVSVSREDEPGFKYLPLRAQELDRWAASLKPDVPTVETTEGCIVAAESVGKGVAQPLKDLPLLVVSTANSTSEYRELQKHLLSLSRNSKQFIAAKSFHSVEMSEPRVVIEAIREVVTAVRNRTPLPNQ